MQILLAQNNCIDFSYTKNWFINNESIKIIKQIKTNDNGALLYIEKADFSGTANLRGLMKFTSEGNLQWNQFFYHPNIGAQFSIEHFLQLSSGEYVVAGFILTDTYRVFLMKLSSGGAIIWQKQFINQYISSPNEILNINALIEGKEGDIFFNVMQSNTNFGESNITRLDSQGNILWSNSYWGKFKFAGSALNYDTINRALNIWGEVSTEPDEICTLNNSKKLLAFFELDYLTGNLTQQKNYCVPNNDQRLILEAINYPNQKNLRAFLLSNGYSILINQFLATKKYLCIMLFNEQKKFIKAKYISFDNILPISDLPFFEWSIDESSGSILVTVRIINSVTNNYYLYSLVSLLTNNLEPVNQLVIENTANDLFTVGPLFLKNGSVNFIINSSYPVNPNLFHLNYSNTLPGAISEAFCKARDTTFGIYEPFVLIDNTYKINFDSIYRNVFMNDGNPGIAMASTNFNSISTCVKYSICDSLKISGNKIACNLLDSFLYTAYKNPQCLKNIEWSIDTAFADAVKSKDSLKIKFKKTGTTVIYASLAGCTLKDSLVVNITLPKNHCNIETDSLLCPGETKVLKAPKGFAAYRWSNGSNADSTLVANIGWYYVKASDSCGNSFTDSIQLQKADTSLAFLQNQTICNNDTVMLPIPAYIKSLSWQPQQGISRMGNTILFYPQQTSVYQINAVFNGNCTAQKNIAIAVKHCPQTVFVPNSFTPNNDGLNDRFKPVFGRAVEQYYFVVYNRYGQKLFESRNPQLAWDGSYNGIAQQTGSFAWMCRYAFANQPKKLLKGTVILIR